MALPNKVVEQLGRAPVRTPGWSGRVLMFSATFLIIGLATYLGIRFGLQPFTQSRIDQVEARVSEFARQVPLDQQLEIAALYSQVVNLRSLLDQQSSQLTFLGWLERNTNTNVQITDLALDNENGNDRSLVITGVARTLDNLAEQLNLFRTLDGTIDRAELLGVTPPDSRGGAWDFQISLRLSRDFYDKAPVSVVSPQPEVVTEEPVPAPAEEEVSSEESSDDEGGEESTS